MAKDRRKFEVAFTVINEEAKRARAEEIAGYKNVAREADRAAKQAADAQARATRQQADLQARAARQQTDLVAKAARQQADIQAKAARQQAAFVEAQRKAQERANESLSRGLSGMIGFGASAGIAQVSFQKLLAVIEQVPAAIEEARKASAKLGTDFGDKREQLAELAVTKGTVADNKFVIENAEFNRKAGFRFGEGMNFRNAFAGSGEQYKGTKMSPQEFQQYEEQAAKLTLAKAVDPEVGGNFAGGLLGVKDYSKFGKDASENAIADYNASLGIMAAGKGKMSVNVRQAEEVNSALVNEDGMKGLIRDPKISAMLVSAAAEFNPAESAVMVRSSLKGLRAFNDPKSLPILQRAGLTPDQMPNFDPIEAFKKLKPVVEAEAKAKGLTVDDVLKNYFPDVQTAQGIGVMLNRGVGDPGQGIFEQRQKLMEGKVEGQPAIGGVGPAMKAVEDFKDTDIGNRRLAQASGEASQIQAGEKVANIELLREQAKAALTARNEYGDTASTSVRLQNKVINATGFGFVDAEEERINEEMRRTLIKRGRRAGMTMHESDYPSPWTSEGTNSQINSMISEIEKGGGNWKSDDEVKQLLRDLPGKIAEAVRPPTPMVDARPAPVR